MNISLCLIVLMKIYTKTGDQGKTRLVDGECVEKHNPRVEAYGTVDELNSQIGLIVSILKTQSLQPSYLIYSDQINDLERIQHHLFRVGSLVATTKPSVAEKLPQIDQTHIHFLENCIDTLDAELTPLKNFILPAGMMAASATHIARTICRRSERRVSEITEESSPESTKNVLIYLNRLSDYLFTLARWINQKNSTPETPWNKEL